jgi:transcriptional regulator with XRE-family HTH domain
MAKKIENSGKITPRPGAVLKRIRRQQGLTLSEVNKLTGLPISTLSKVENDKLALSYDKLARLSTGLNVDIGIFFGAVEGTATVQPQEMLVTHGRRSITRRGEGSAIATDNYDYLYPAADLLNKRIEPLIVQVKARSLEEFGDFMRHEGEEFAYVLSGTVEFHTQFYTPVILETGDSIYFDSTMGHAYVAISKSPCRVLSVCDRKAPSLR